LPQDAPTLYERTGFGQGKFILALRYGPLCCGKAPSVFVIEPNQVHLWWIDVDQPNLLHTPALLLSEEERLRAARFKFSLLQDRWTMARAAVRVILGSYLGISPSSLTFSYNNNGKPEINNSEYDGTLQFNVSHSERLCALALTRFDRVGVDVEQIREIPDTLDIAKESFSESEYKSLLTETSEQRTPRFLRLWTEKEAYLKALGHGLGQIPGWQTQPASQRIIHKPAANSSASVPQWHYREVDPDPHYCASLALCSNTQPTIIKLEVQSLHES
jgi:4'-phosphopantetheinyl transferase